MRSRRGDLRGASRFVSRREAVDARRVHLMMKWAVSFVILSEFGRDSGRSLDAVRIHSKFNIKPPTSSCDGHESHRGTPRDAPHGVARDEREERVFGHDRPVWKSEFKRHSWSLGVCVGCGSLYAVEGMRGTSCPSLGLSEGRGAERATRPLSLGEKRG